MRWLSSALLVAALGGGLACAAPPPAGDPAALRALLVQRMAEAPRAAGSIRVLLAFTPDFDLDLYVTDPLEEAVYFGNPETPSGGRLGADLRCESPGGGSRIETIVFASPLHGRYRVGVDHPRTCTGKRGSASFAVGFESAGGTLWAVGALETLVFEPIVLETSVGP